MSNVMLLAYALKNLPNYTGPYRSNGKFQASVEFGDAIPVDALDALSRLHDSAYARFKDNPALLSAADRIYERGAYALGGVTPTVAGAIVRYVNGVARLVAQGSFDNCSAAQCSALEAEVEQYFMTDPLRKHFQSMGGVPSVLSLDGPQLRNNKYTAKNSNLAVNPKNLNSASKSTTIPALPKKVSAPVRSDIPVVYDPSDPLPKVEKTVYVQKNQPASAAEPPVSGAADAGVSYTPVEVYSGVPDSGASNWNTGVSKDIVLGHSSSYFRRSFKRKKKKNRVFVDTFESKQMNALIARRAQSKASHSWDVSF